MLLRWIAH